MGQEQTSFGQNRRRAGRPRIPRDIEIAIEGFAAEGYTPPQILEALQRKADFKGRALPVIKTIKRIIEREGLAADASEWWSLAAADPDDAATILPVLATVIERTAGRVPSLTKAQADWVLKIRCIAPDLSPWSAFRLAISYRVRVHREEPTADLDELLAFTPWRSREHLERFLRVVNSAHPDWIQTTGGWVKLAQVIILAMEMQKGAEDDSKRQG